MNGVSPSPLLASPECGCQQDAHPDGEAERERRTLPRPVGQATQGVAAGLGGRLKRATAQVRRPFRCRAPNLPESIREFAEYGAEGGDSLVADCGGAGRSLRGSIRADFGQFFFDCA
jgi:hypothetical protein